MDIQKIISDIAAKITGNSDLIKKFTSNPVGIVKELLGIDISADKVDELVKGVTEKLGGELGGAAKQGKGLLSKILGIFGKK